MRQRPTNTVSRHGIGPLILGILWLSGCTAFFGPVAGERVVTGLTASTDRTAEVQLSWEEIDGSPVYRIYRTTSQDAEPALYESTRYPELIDRSVDKNRDYFYRVSIVDPRSGAEGPLSAAVIGRRGDTAQAWETPVSLGTVLHGLALDPGAASAAEGVYALAANAGDPLLYRYQPETLDWLEIGLALSADSGAAGSADLVLARLDGNPAAHVAYLQEGEAGLGFARLIPTASEPTWEDLPAPGAALSGRELSEVLLVGDDELSGGSLVILARASEDGSSATTDDGVLYYSRWTGSAWTNPVAIDDAANALVTQAARWNGNTWVAVLVDVLSADGGDGIGETYELRLIQLGDSPVGTETGMTDFIDGAGDDGERQWIPQTLALSATPADTGALVIAAALDPADGGGTPIRVSSGDGTAFSEVSPDPAELDVVEPAPSLAVLAGDAEWVLAYPDAGSGSLRLVSSSDTGTSWAPTAPLPLNEDGEEEDIAPAGAAGLRLAGSDTSLIAIGWNAGFTAPVRIFR